MKEEEGLEEEDTWILIVDNSCEELNRSLPGLHNTCRFDFG